MCSITVLYNKNITPETENLLRFRGPDDEYEVVRNGFLMKHYLLSLTGNMVRQPIVDNDIVCLFNGEIYNYKDFGNFESDVYAIIESYKRYGDDFVPHLDGEFALFLIDFKENVFYMSSDIFGIKPLYYSFNPTFGLSTHESFLDKNGYNDIKKIKPNTTLKFNLDFNLLSEKTIHTFNLDQYVDNFDKWNESFLSAVKKRFGSVSYGVILPLSSGHDSGGIACACNVLNIPYISYSIDGKEDMGIVKKRMELNTGIAYSKNKINKDECQKHLNNNCENFYYGEFHDSKDINGLDDSGANGLVHILNEIKATHPNTKIMASGQGADEIMSNKSNYSFGGTKNPSIYNDDTLNGFPWQNVFEGANSSYLKKEESISGSFGIEGRYPYLDKDVVQAYLNLTPTLKNMYFKSPLTNFLNIHNYPINNVKKGFNPSF